MGQNSSQEAPRAPPWTPRPLRPVREIYARYLESEDGLLLSRLMAAAERLRVTGLEEDPEDHLAGSMLRLHPELVITRATTLGALSQLQGLSSMHGHTPSPYFLQSEAATFLIDELEDYNDPEVGLERLLDEGCASDEEKERLRSIVQNSLIKLQDQEQGELHALRQEASRQATLRSLARAEANLDRIDPTGELRAAAARAAAKKPRARSAKPAAKKPSRAKKPAVKKPSRAKPRAKKPAHRRRASSSDLDDLFEWVTT